MAAIDEVAAVAGRPPMVGLLETVEALKVDGARGPFGGVPLAPAAAVVAVAGLLVRVPVVERVLPWAW